MHQMLYSSKQQQQQQLSTILLQFCDTVVQLYNLIATMRLEQWNKVSFSPLFITTGTLIH